MMGPWNKLKKTLSLKASSGGASSRSRNRSTSQSDARSTVAKSPSRSPSSVTSSASFFSRFSRSVTSTSGSSKDTCAICLGNMKIGEGQAIFTAECSHSFHFSCIANNVRCGNHLCPICCAKWKEIPFQNLGNANTHANRNAAGRAQVSPYQAPLEDYSRLLQPPSPSADSEPLEYNDDEPLLRLTSDLTLPTSDSHSNNVTIKAFPEFPAIAATDSVSAFAVLVGLQALPILDDARHVERAPVDLVTVLDVSRSMAGSKLSLLKRAVCFVIDNLDPSDRLSIVSFSTNARRVFPLRRMINGGREDAKLAVDLLSSDGGTDIVQGLEKGARVLEERRERNPVASIILLSDGRNTYNSDMINYQHHLRNQTRSGPREYLNLLPASISPRNRETRTEGQQLIFPVHTFGFGSDHDSSAMHAISDASGGTFSFIESVGMVQEAFARCIGGLLSVVAQEVQLTVRSASPQVEIGSIPSGRYTSEIFEQGSLGVVNVGDLYADEEKEFLVYLSVPIFPASKGEESLAEMPLLEMVCSFRDTVSKELVRVEGETVTIRRPNILSPRDVTISLEVDRQRNRLMVAEGIAEAQEIAEMGNLESAQALLTNRRATLLSSASAQAADNLCKWLDAELREIRERMMSMEMYEHTGRAYMLSGLSSHSWQRATTRGTSITQATRRGGGGSSNNTVSIGYDTPSMISMVSRSQNLSLRNHRRNEITRLPSM